MRADVTQGFPWREMIDDAIDKMVAGITTIDELVRVFGEYAEERCARRGIDHTKYRLRKYLKD